jgi:hypothetical protein
MNADLRLGATDGEFKNLTPDRGGDVETEAVLKRASVSDNGAYPAMHGFVNRSPLAEVNEQYL